DQVDPALEVARDVARGFALAEPDVPGRQVDRGAAELPHPDLEGDPRPEARLLEDHRERASREQRMQLPRAQLRLQPAGEREDALDLLASEVGDTEKIALHAASSARSRMASPSSTCARVTTSGGRKRSTRSAVQLMSSPSSRQRRTIAAPGRSSSAPS